jgi:hypothetical protein
VQEQLSAMIAELMPRNARTRGSARLNHSAGLSNDCVQQNHRHRQLPAGQRVTNHDLAAQLAAKGIETSDEWIVTRSGISARHYAAADEKCRPTWPSRRPARRSRWPA